MSKDQYLSKALKWAEKKGYTILKSKADGYEDPKTFTNTNKSFSIQPDITCKAKNGGKHYTDIALKSDNKQNLVTRWKLFSQMASMKQGKLHLLAPRGHKSFVNRLVSQYNIEANVISL